MIHLLFPCRFTSFLYLKYGDDYIHHLLSLYNFPNGSYAWFLGRTSISFLYINHEFEIWNGDTILLGALAISLGTTISFLTHVRLSAVRPHRTTRLPQTDFHEIWYLNIFRQSVKKIQVLLKYYRNNNNNNNMYLFIYCNWVVTLWQCLFYM